MKRIQTWRWVPAAVLLAMGGTTGRAEELTIQSFDGTGKLSFNRVATAETYRVEWAPSPAGPWTNFTGAAGAALDSIPQFAGGSYTSTVPMCYRVVATVTNAGPPQPEGLFLVVDLSGGTSAVSYAVSQLDAVPSGGWTDEHKTTKLVLRRIPSTTPDFTMGSPAGELGHESNETQHQVTLTQDFYLGVFEVTQRQWELVMGNNPSWFTNATHYQTRPVDTVTYYDIRENPANSDDPAVDWPANNAVNATSFMGKLRAKTGLTGFDLPTESQWEYACRAGTTTALNSGYNLTSLDIDPHMSEVGRNFNNGGLEGYNDQGCAPSAGTAAAGSYLANAWGLYDMHGNVWEWCLDRYGTYPGIVTDPKGDASEYDRIYRGGCWGNIPWYCRSATRNFSAPDDPYYGIGFRACCTPLGQP
jgi:formylglycine-generating enzyme required for sulfatase activity